MNEDQIRFASQKEWEAWLKKNHASAKGLWLILAKKGAAKPSVSYAEAVDAALMYGWIDGLKRSRDESTWLQRFTPRGKTSIWSKINRDKAEALIRAKKMKPAGQREVDRAKEDGRWQKAYDSAKSSEVPSDLTAALSKNKKAAAFFATLSGTNRYAILFRIQTVKKAETRTRKITEFVSMLARGETIYPQKKP